MLTHLFHVICDNYSFYHGLVLKCNGNNQDILRFNYNMEVFHPQHLYSCMLITSY